MNEEPIEIARLIRLIWQIPGDKIFESIPRLKVRKQLVATASEKCVDEPVVPITCLMQKILTIDAGQIAENFTS